jgi:hypothetical protein
LGKERKTHLGVLEASFSNALIPFLVLPLTLTFLPEYKQWSILSHPSTTTAYSLLGNGARHGQSTIVAIMTLLLVALSLSKYLDRVSKFYVVGQASTLFYAVLDSNMKIIAGIGAFMFFDEVISLPKIIGFCFIALSLVLTVVEKSGVGEDEIRSAMKWVYFVQQELCCGWLGRGDSSTQVPWFLYAFQRNVFSRMDDSTAGPDESIAENAMCDYHPESGIGFDGKAKVTLKRTPSGIYLEMGAADIIELDDDSAHRIYNTREHTMDNMSNVHHAFSDYDEVDDIEMSAAAPLTLRGNSVRVDNKMDEEAGRRRYAY